MDILLPDVVEEEIEFEALKAVSGAMLFQEMLREYDAELSLLKAKPGATGLKGGYWYIYRSPNRSIGRNGMCWEIAEADGSYCEPRLEHFERLKQKDSWARPGLYHEYRKRQEEASRQKQKTNEELHREFREKLDERIASIYNPSISIAGLVVPGKDAPVKPTATDGRGTG